MADAAPPRRPPQSARAARPGERELAQGTAHRCARIPPEERVLRPEGGRALERTPQGCGRSAEPECWRYVRITAHGGVLGCPVQAQHWTRSSLWGHQLRIFSDSVPPSVFARGLPHILRITVTESLSFLTWKGPKILQ